LIQASACEKPMPMRQRVFAWLDPVPPDHRDPASPLNAAFESYLAARCQGLEGPAQGVEELLVPIARAYAPPGAALEAEKGDL
jgi:hypothetical protein